MSHDHSMMGHDMSAMTHETPSASQAMSHAMAMTFHFDTTQSILFNWWTPTSSFQFIISCFVVFGITLLNVFAKNSWVFFNANGCFPWNVRKTNEDYVAMADLETQKKFSTCGVARNASDFPGIFQPVSSGSILTSFVCLFTTAIDYCLMLAAMTFNVYIVVAVVVGYAMGTFLFGHLSKCTLGSSTAHAHVGESMAQPQLKGLYATHVYGDANKTGAVLQSDSKASLLRHAHTDSHSCHQ